MRKKEFFNEITLSETVDSDMYGIFTFRMRRMLASYTKEHPQIVDELLVRAKIIATDKKGVSTWRVLDGGYAKLNSGELFFDERYFKMRYVGLNKIYINKGLFLRIDVPLKIEKDEKIPISITRDYRGAFLSLLRNRASSITSSLKSIVALCNNNGCVRLLFKKRHT